MNYGDYQEIQHSIMYLTSSNIYAILNELNKELWTGLVNAVSEETNNVTGKAD